MSNELTKPVECPGCEEMQCDGCNPIIDQDCICAGCSEHAVLRKIGTECCEAGSRWSI